ncbi:hypothetical protein FPOA_00231 [Fusarium poae]|uniref:C2H2-type domain-containing protein n=1 Tax=Fusarium poae TaxID=36050 RepID=A0A1B8B0S5_FUSPO|nr:hypothetical protein FPOA_00231 [Fusarium poae]
MADIKPQPSGPRDTFKCTTCKRGFANKKILIRHRRLKHRNPQSATSTAQAALERVLSQAVASQSGGPFSDIDISIRDGRFSFSAKLRNLDQSAPDAQTNTSALSNSQNNHASHTKLESQSQVTLEAPVQQMGESSATFNSQYALGSHKKVKHKTIKCPDCNRSFYLQKAVENHQRDKHAAPRISPPRQIKQEPEELSEPIVHTQPPVCQYPADCNEFKPTIEPITTSTAHQHLVDVKYRPMTPPLAYHDDHCMRDDAPEPLSGPITASFANQHPVDDRSMNPPCAYSNDQDGDSHYSSGSDSDQNSDSTGSEEEDDSADDEDDGNSSVDDQDETRWRDGDKWPEYGERLSGMSCLAKHLGCSQIFHKASGMLYHVETCHQNDFLWKSPDDLFQAMMQLEEIRMLYDQGTNLYYCPICRGTQQGIFRSISFLVKHAESNLCSLKIRSGPIAKLYDAVHEYAWEQSEGVCKGI